MASNDALHLHPLSFTISLEALPTLNSTQLALVAFHPDAVPSLVNKARIVWHKRRAAALERGEQQIHSMAPSSAPPSSKRPPRAVPRQFDHLVRTLRLAHERGESHPLRAKIGSQLKEGRQDLYDEGGMPRDFRAYCSEAERLGIVQLNSGQMNGRDWIALTDEYMPAGLTAPSAPPAPPVDSFHLFSLSFPLDLENMASLSSAQLLAVQFRDDIPDEMVDSRGLTVADRVEAIFWKRRSLALGAGQKWEDAFKPTELANQSMAPSLVQRIFNQPPPHQHAPVIRMPEQAFPVSYPPVAAYRAPSPPPRQTAPTPIYPPLPSLYTPLPPGLASSFFVLHITRLPPNAIDSVASLHALLPSHLTPVATVLYAPSTSPTNPTPSRRAHMAYRSFDKRVGALDAVNTVLVKGPTGESWKVRGDAVTTKLPTWEWGDVRKDLRETVWREVCEKEGVEVDSAAFPATATALDKRPRDMASTSLAYDAQREDDAKRRRLSATSSIPSAASAPRHLPPTATLYPINTAPSSSTYAPQYPPPSVAPSSQPPSSQVAQAIEGTPDGVVPAAVVEPLYELHVSFGNQPRDLNSHRPRDDLFVGRFGAVGWTLRNVPGKYNFHILFNTKLQRELAEEWMLNANRYWKNNDMNVNRTRIHPSPDFWRWSNFTESYRLQHGVAAIKEGTTRGNDEWGRPCIVGSTTGQDIPLFAFEKTDYWQGLVKHSKETREKREALEAQDARNGRPRSLSSVPRLAGRDSPSAGSRGRSRSPPPRRPRSPPAAVSNYHRSPSPLRSAPQTTAQNATNPDPVSSPVLPQEKAAYVRRVGLSEVNVNPFQVLPPAADPSSSSYDGHVGTALIGAAVEAPTTSGEAERSADDPSLTQATPLASKTVNSSLTVTSATAASPSPRPGRPSSASLNDADPLPAEGVSSLPARPPPSIHDIPFSPIEADVDVPLPIGASSSRGGLLSRLAAAGNSLLDRVGHSPDRIQETQENSKSLQERMS